MQYMCTSRRPSSISLVPCRGLGSSAAYRNTTSSSGQQEAPKERVKQAQQMHVAEGVQSCVRVGVMTWRSETSTQFFQLQPYAAGMQQAKHRQAVSWTGAEKPGWLAEHQQACSLRR